MMLTKTEKIIVILLVVVAIVNFYSNMLIPFIWIGYDAYTLNALTYSWIFFGWIIEILVVAVLILMIRKE